MHQRTPKRAKRRRFRRSQAPTGIAVRRRVPRTDPIPTES
ncbi:hypothetical protein FHR71_005352 [Methylobacterium sp. RAS18]|nr:hypothetical protein [Methylobacterium sp. RAS18]